MQINNDEFFKIIIKCCKKLVELKELTIALPEVLPKDLNMKYKESQKLVDFIKVNLMIK